MIIAISDTHLIYGSGKEGSNSSELESFLQSDFCKKLGDEDHLVLLGDIFEFWRRANVKTVLDSNKILAEIKKLQKNKVQIHYIQGNHDYSILKLFQRSKKYPFEVTPDWRHQIKGKKYYFVHGYQLDVFANYEPVMNLEDYENWCLSLCERSDDVIGTIMSTLYAIPKPFVNLGKKLEELIKSQQKKKGRIDPVKKLKEAMDEIETSPDGVKRKKKIPNVEELASSPLSRSIFLGMESDEWLIFGHTHRPFLEKENRVANTGSWVGEGNEKKKVNTFVKIDENGVQLLQWMNSKVVLIKES